MVAQRVESSHLATSFLFGLSRTVEEGAPVIFLFFYFFAASHHDQLRCRAREIMRF